MGTLHEIPPTLLQNACLPLLTNSALFSTKFTNSTKLALDHQQNSTLTGWTTLKFGSPVASPASPHHFKEMVMKKLFGAAIAALLLAGTASLASAKELRLSHQ